MVELSTVVPVFNEAPNVPPLCERPSAVAAFLPRRLEVIFVNDGSRDETLTLLREQRVKLPTLKIMSLSRRFGQAAVGAPVLLEQPRLRDGVSRFEPGSDSAASGAGTAPAAGAR